jgi:hypothetical protein
LRAVPVVPTFTVFCSACCRTAINDKVLVALYLGAADSLIAVHSLKILPARLGYISCQGKSLGPASIPARLDASFQPSTSNFNWYNPIAMLGPAYSCQSCYKAFLGAHKVCLRRGERRATDHVLSLFSPSCLGAFIHHLPL